MKSQQEAVATAFRKVFLWDATMAQPGRVAEYQAMFPGHEQLIASEYERISSSAQSGGAEVKESKLERRFGPYRIDRVLGRGGQGTVYSAIDSRDGRTVALKVFRADGANRQRRLQRLRREASATANLDHPGICRFRETGLHEGVPYLAMHLVPGTSLAQRIAHARRAHPEALGTVEASAHLGLPGDDSGVVRCVRFFEQVARAIHAAHEAGLIHRDLKPGNLMVTPAGDPVILDFGLVRDEDEGATITVTGAVLGTIAYMAPEQVAEGSPRLDRRVDVYALGVSLFEALTFLHPFQAATREAALRASQAGDPRNLRDLDDAFPADLALVVATAMRRDRDRRYETTLAFAEDLEAFRLRRRIRAKPLTAAQRVADWAKRHPAVAASTAVAFMSLGAGLAVSLQLLGTTQTALASERKHREGFEEMTQLVLETQGQILDTGRTAQAEKLAQKAKELFESNQAGELTESQLALLADIFATLANTAERQPGGRPKAVENWERSEEIRTRLHDEHPGVPAYANGLAICLGAHARRAAATSPAEAIAIYGRALAILDGLPPPLSEDLNVRVLRCDYAWAVGEQQQRVGQLADAHATLVAAASRAQDLLRDEPDEAKASYEAVYAELQLTYALSEMGRTTEARSRVDRLLERARKAVTERDKDPELASMLADVLRADGDLARDRGDFDAAAAELTESIAIFERLRGVDGKNVRWRNQFASGHDKLALTFMAAGRFDEAVAASKPAREIAAIASTMPAAAVDGRSQREIGQIFRTSGAALGRSGATEAALADLDEAARWFERAQQGCPADVNAQLAAILTLQERGTTLLVAAGRAEPAAVADWAGRALSTLDRADALARSLLAEHPDQARVARQRAWILGETAKARILLGDAPGAAGALEEAIRLRDALAASDSLYVARLRDLDAQLAQARLPAGSR